MTAISENDRSVVSILYTDDRLTVAVKPAGVLSETEMPELLERATGKRHLTVHRLDREVGGVMVYAKDASCAAELSSQITDHIVTKEYLAVVCGVPNERSGRLSDLLYHDRNKNKTYVVDRKRAGVKEAELVYDTLMSTESDEGILSLVKIRLITGRTHQIRAQFSSRGIPLVGDARYGGKRIGNGISLWSYRIGFTNNGEKMTYECVPDERIGTFGRFRNIESLLREGLRI